MTPITPASTGLNRLSRRWHWSFRRKLSPETPVVIPFDSGLKVGLRPIDRIGRRILLDGYSDRAVAGFIAATLRPGMVFFDLGAHLGQFSLMASTRVGPAGQVHSFEPTPATFAELQANVALNGLSNITLNHAAVTDRPGTVTLSCCHSGQESFNSLGTPIRPAATAVQVPGVTLDEYLESHRIGRVDLLKADIEGAEVLALRGAGFALAEKRIAVMILEINRRALTAMNFTIDALFDQIHAAGYRCWRMDESGAPADESRAADIGQETENLIVSVTKPQTARPATP